MGKSNSMAAGAGAYADTYQSRPGYSMSSYSPGQSMSLEAQSQRSANMANPIATPQSRAANQAVVREWDDSAPERQMQATGVQTQMTQLDQEKAARDALVNSLPPEDPVLVQLQEEEENYRNQYDALERELDRLTKPSAEYTRAQEEEAELLRQEQEITSGLDNSLLQIKGQPIPQGFLTGQSARQVDLANVGLNRIAGQKQTLQQKLATIQEKRQAAMDVVRSKLSRAGDRLNTISNRSFDYSEDRRKEKRDDERYEREQADKREQDRYKTIGDGAYLYDTVLGRVVSQNEKNFAPRSGSPSESPSGGVESLYRGPDGYVDPYEYAKIRAQVRNASDFDRRYGYLVNPTSKAKFGISGGSSGRDAGS